MFSNCVPRDKRKPVCTVSTQSLPWTTLIVITYSSFFFPHRIYSHLLKENSPKSNLAISFYSNPLYLNITQTSLSDSVEASCVTKIFELKR